jgi:hypothetical protein
VRFETKLTYLNPSQDGSETAFSTSGQSIYRYSAVEYLGSTTLNIAQRN